MNFAIDNIVTCGNPGCDKKFLQSEQYAFHCGEYYCCYECYMCLFAKCNKCGRITMSALSNSKVSNHAIHPEWAEQLCDDCFNKKHNLRSVTLIFGPFK